MATSNPTGHEKRSPDQSSTSLAQGNPTDVGNAKGQFTTIREQTTFVTTGVSTTAVTTTLPNGQASVITIVTSGTRTLTTETGVISQIGSVSSRSGPPKAIIGGIIGATVVVVLGLVVLCILRHKRRQRTITSNSNLETSHPLDPPTENVQPQTHQLTTMPRPLLGLPSAQGTPSARQGTYEYMGSVDTPIGNDQDDQEQERDPFRDPMIGERERSSEEVQGNALDRLQQLTSQLEAELQQLSELAQSGQLSVEDRARLEEIRSTTGLTMPFNPRRGHLSVATSHSSYSTAPPSYHTHES